jgi:hypothetical protein
MQSALSIPGERTLVWVLVGFASACSGDDAPGPDAGLADAGRRDAGEADAGADAAGPRDAGTDATPLDGGRACVGPDVLGPLQFFLDQLSGSGGSLADWAAADELTGFVMAPGLPQPPGIALHQSELGEACSAPFVSDEVCSGRSPPFSCMSYECSGMGAGWITRLRTQPVDTGDWAFEDARVATSWVDGADRVTFVIASTGSGPGDRDWSCTGSGFAARSELQVTVELPALHDEGPTTLEYRATAALREGELRIGTRVVATVDAAGTLVAETGCP